MAAKTIGMAQREKDILLDQLRDGKHKNDSLLKSIQSLSIKVDELEDVHKGLELKFS